MWRPKIWQNPYKAQVEKERQEWYEDLESYGHPDLLENLERDAEIYEIGATAMLNQITNLLRDWDNGLDNGEPYKFWHRTFILPESLWKELNVKLREPEPELLKKRQGGKNNA